MSRPPRLVAHVPLALVALQLALALAHDPLGLVHELLVLGALAQRVHHGLELRLGAKVRAHQGEVCQLADGAELHPGPLQRARARIVVVAARLALRRAGRASCLQRLGALELVERCAWGLL